jgi:hypothetical protein
MNTHARSPGRVSVGQLSEQPAFEACIVTYLRLWADGEESQIRLQQMLIELCGPTRGVHMTKRWAELVALFAQFHRRSITHHALDYPRLGADEAWFANFMATAATGEREDALMLATLMIRHDIAPMLADLAQQFGLGLTQGLLQQGPAVGQGVPETLH